MLACVSRHKKDKPATGDRPRPATSGRGKTINPKTRGPKAMKHIHRIIEGIAIMVVIMKEAKRHPQAKTLADLDNEQ